MSHDDILRRIDSLIRRWLALSSAFSVPDIYVINYYAGNIDSSKGPCLAYIYVYVLCSHPLLSLIFTGA